MNVHDRARRRWGSDFRVHGNGAISCVDVTEVARKVGFDTKVALTQAAWDDSVRWIPNGPANTLWPQIQSERLWSLLSMARLAFLNGAAQFWLLRVSTKDADGLGCSRLTLATTHKAGGRLMITIDLDSECRRA